MDATTDGLPADSSGHSPVGIQVLDADGLTTRVNDAFPRMLGYESAEHVTGVVNAHTCPVMRAQGLTPYVERAYRGESVQTPVLPSRPPRPPGSALRARIVPLTADSGGVRGIVVFVEDASAPASHDGLSRRRRGQIEALDAAFPRIAATVAAEDMLPAVLDAMRGLDLAEGGAVWMVDPDSQRWNCAASYGLSDRCRADVKILCDVEASCGRLPGMTLWDNGPLVVSDISSGAVQEQLREILLREGVRRMFAVPLRDGDDVVGALGFYGHEPGDADPFDMKMASLLACELSVALRNVRHYEYAREAAAEVEVMNRTAGILTEPGGMEDALRAIADVAASIMGASRVGVHVLDPSTINATLMAYAGPDAAHGAADAEGIVPVVMTNPDIRHTLESMETVTLDLAGDSGRRLLPDERRCLREAFGPRSLLLVPICEKEHVVGLMTFDRPGEERPWTPLDVRLAERLACHASIALRNARFASDARAMREWLEDKVDERTAELRAAHAEVMAAEKLAAVGFMAREVAHGLRNPLNVLSTSLYYLRSRQANPDEKITRHFETMERAVQQAANTITQMMNLAGSRQPDMAPVDLNLLAQRAVEERRAVDDFRWVAQWDTQLPRVRGDWTQISQAAKALIGYAAGPGGIVHLRTSREGNRAVLAVGDDRPPLTPEQRDALFQPFTASATVWTGLGLSVARQIAVKHDGDLTLSERDGLTWVCLELPLMDAG